MIFLTVVSYGPVHPVRRLYVQLVRSSIFLSGFSEVLISGVFLGDQGHRVNNLFARVFAVSVCGIRVSGPTEVRQSLIMCWLSFRCRLIMLPCR